VEAGHSRALAPSLARLLEADFGVRSGARTVVGIAGESGSGKSETALGLARELEARGTACAVLHQDDYFLRPPRTNHEHRLVDLGSVGPQEVDLPLLASHVAAFRLGRDDVTGPRVDYPGNRFLTRRLDFAPVAALIVEGTYVLRLDDLDVRVFLEATHEDSRERRRARARDVDAPVIETILAIEHRIIVQQAARADVLIDRDFAIRPRR
jgi:uridine kinase